KGVCYGATMYSPGSKRDLSMRQGQQNKRMRGRNRKGPNPLTRSYESNGPDVKIRGTALRIAEKYVQLARDAQASRDRVGDEDYRQHAEHYYRIVAAAQALMPQPQQIYRNDDEGDEDEERLDRANGHSERPQSSGNQPAFGLSDPQPYVNANGASTDDEDAAPSAAAADENRAESSETRESRSRGENGGFRGRRRRPYRERYSGAQGGIG